MNKFGIGERSAWGDFPDVIRNGDLGSLKNEPEYIPAKSGNTNAAIDLVYKLLTTKTIKSIKSIVGMRSTILLPVKAVESKGNNKIPLAYSELLADRLGLEVDEQILQIDKVARTDQGADHRLAFNPRFRGTVKKSKLYFLIDDTLTMGGTLASLKGFVENRGGFVIGATVMTAHPSVLSLPIKDQMIRAISLKHGIELNNFWEETFSYGIEKLTQGEAGHLRAAKSVNEIRNRIIAARYAGITYRRQTSY